MGISYDEYRANGYKEVWGIGDKDLIRRFCNAERLLLTKVVDIDTALYDANKPEGFVIEEDLGEDRKFLAYKLGCRGFVKFLDGYSDPEVDYFIKREKEYWKRARSVGREKKRESGKYMGGVVPILASSNLSTRPSANMVFKANANTLSSAADEDMPAPAGTSPVMAALNPPRVTPCFSSSLHTPKT